MQDAAEVKCGGARAVHDRADGASAPGVLGGDPGHDTQFADS